MSPPLEAWGLVGVPEPLPVGHRNIVLRVGHHVLKTTRRDEAGIAWLAPVERIAVQCGFQMPLPVRSARGSFVVEGWTCEPFHMGTPTPPREIRARMERFHSLARPLRQRPGFMGSHLLLSNPRGGDMDLTRLPSMLRRAVRAAWADMPAARATVVHGDLNPSNILTDASGRITLIDWDEARWDHPGFDDAQYRPVSQPVRRAAKAWEIACSWQVEPAHARRLALSFLREH